MRYGVRSIIAVMMVCITCSSARAQKLFFVFAHGQYASPLQTNFKNDYNFGLGAEGGVGIGFGKKTFLTGTVGYNVFDAKSGTESDLGNITAVPVKIGLRRYFLPLNLLYIHADAGVASIRDKSNGGSNYSTFTGDIGAGVKLGLFELGVAYDGFKRRDAGFASSVAFKAGWRFGL